MRSAGRHAGDSLVAAHGWRQIGAVEFGEGGLAVKEIDMRRAAGLEEVDDALRFWRDGSERLEILTGRLRTSGQARKQ
jgi:hypothetical protein